MRSLVFLFTSLLVVQLSAQTYQSIEAVEFDPGSGHFFISNGSSIIDRAPNGTLSYFGNASATHGMEVMNNTLFAIAGGTINGYDLNTGDEVTSISIAGAQFLNGMANDGISRIWVTDFQAKKIYEIDFSDLASPSYVQVVGNTFSTPNGIVYDDSNNRLIFVNWGGASAIKAVDLSNYEVTTIATTSLENCDGIDKDGENNYYVSSWNPTRITKFNEDFSTDEIITAPGLSGPADISYAVEIDSLGIPNSFTQTVTFVGFGAVDIPVNGDDAWNFKVYPNPVTEDSRITFNAHKSLPTKLEVIDSEGRLVNVLLHEKITTGQHTILMRGIQFKKGYYIYRLTQGENVLHFPFLVQ
jgi:hypothetical protein